MKASHRRSRSLILKLVLWTGGTLATASTAHGQTCPGQSTPDNSPVTIPICESPFAIAVNGENESIRTVPDADEAAGLRGYYLRNPPSSNLWISEVSTDNYARHSSPFGLRDAATSVGGIHGSRSLSFQGYGWDAAGNSWPGGGNDRLELTLSQSGGPVVDVQEFGEWRYLRFFVKVKSSFGILKNGSKDTDHEVMISQVWQRGSNTVGPPFAINLARIASDSSVVEARFIYRNETYNDEKQACGLAPDHVTFRTEKLPFDKWVEFIVQMKPVYYPHVACNPANPSQPCDSTSRGAILVWRLDSTDGVNWSPSCGPSKGVVSSNGSSGLPQIGVAPFRADDACNVYQQPDTNSRFFWGYRPKPSANLEGKFDIRVGLYRQAAMPAAVSFDSIMLANHENKLTTLNNVQGGACAP